MASMVLDHDTLKIQFCHLKQAAERFAELISEVVLGIDRQIVLQDIHRILTTFVSCSPFRRLPG